MEGNDITAMINVQFQGKNRFFIDTIQKIPFYLSWTRRNALLCYYYHF